MKKTYTKSVIALVVLVAIAVVGFGTAFGYGGSSKSGGRRSVVITTPSVGQVLGASTYTFTTYLSFGMSSDAVKELQERLRKEGFFTYPTSTGYFGPITLAAVKAYQTAHGIPSTGFVGPLTIAELNK